MTTKKKTPKGTKDGDARSVAARARRMTTNVRGFDIDTRAKLHLALDTIEFWRGNAGESGALAKLAKAERELREYVERAGRGESLSDVSDVEAKYVEAARAVIELMEMPGMPDYVSRAVFIVLTELQEQTGAGIWQDLYKDADAALGDFSRSGMARAFANHSFVSIEVEPARDLAGLINAVLMHSDTPAVIYNALSKAMSELTSTADMDSTEVIRVVLEGAKAKSAEGGA